MLLGAVIVWNIGNLILPIPPWPRPDLFSRVSLNIVHVIVRCPKLDSVKSRQRGPLFHHSILPKSPSRATSSRPFHRPLKDF
jgi:hypothetical protein